MDGFLARGGGWVAAQLAFFVAYVWALRFTVEFPSAASGAGWLIAAAGAALAVGGLVTLGPNLTPFPEPLAEGRLIERGVYRLVRHPIYGGLCLGAMGFAIARSSPPALVVGMTLLVFFWFKVHGEEQRLTAAYPGYVGYQARVRARLVPWLL